MAQNLTIAGASYSDVPSIQIPKTGGGNAIFVDTSDGNASASDITSGKTAYVNGVKITGTSTGPSGLKTQVVLGESTGYKNATYGALGMYLVIEQSGTYDISWVAVKGGTIGTFGTQLYINDVAYGTAIETFEHDYGGCVTLTGVLLSAGDRIEIWGRSRNTSTTIWSDNLIAKQTS